METKFALFSAVSFVIPGLVAVGGLIGLMGCDGGDDSLQSEMAELRERVRIAESERDRAIREGDSSKSKAESTHVVGLDVLRGNMDAATKRIREELVATFIGYRVDSISSGQIAYVFEGDEPYRGTVEFALRPANASAQIAEVPPVVIELRAGPSGQWQIPTRAMLRENLVNASARAASRPRTAGPVETPPAQTSPPGNPAGARVISWGDPAVPNPAPAAPNPGRAPSGPGGPRATETREIRFND